MENHFASRLFSQANFKGEGVDGGGSFATSEVR